MNLKELHISYNYTYYIVRGVEDQLFDFRGAVYTMIMGL